MLRIGRIPYRKNLLNQLKLKKKKELTEGVRAREVKHFGHVNRHDTIMKTILQGRIEGEKKQEVDKDVNWIIKKKKNELDAAWSCALRKGRRE